MGGEAKIQVLPGLEGSVNPLDEAQLHSERARQIFEATEDFAPWMDDYFQLIADGWNWRQAAYMIWAAQPKEKRWPKTQWGLATEVLGLTSDRQIREWRRNNPAIDKQIHTLTVSVVVKRRADVMDALMDSASNPNPRNHADRKMALEMSGDYVPKQRVFVGEAAEDDLDSLPDEDLRALEAGPNGK